MTVSFGKERVGFGNRPAGDPVSPTNFDIACSFVSAGPIPSDAKNTMAGPGLSVRKSISGAHGRRDWIRLGTLLEQFQPKERGNDFKNSGYA